MDSENDDYVDIIFDDTGTNNAASPLGPLSPSTSSENGDYINIVDDDNNMIAPNARLPPIPIAPLARRQPKRPSSAPLSDTDGWDFESGALFGDDSDAYLSDFLGDSNSDSFDSNNDWDIDNDADIDDDDTYDEEVDDDDDDNAFTPKAHTSHTSRKARKVGNVRKARKGPKGRKAVKDFPKPSKPSKAPLPVPDKMARARITRFCRITKLISSSRLDAAIQDAVKRTQCAVEQATMVLKLMILERFEELTAGEGTNGFTHATARTMANDKIFGFSASLFRRLLSCVAREVAHRGEGRSVGTRELDARIRRAFDDNADLFGERVSGLHLSEVFGIEAFQFQASYKQNIKTHFTKYVRRCTRALVAEATRATIDVLPANARTAALKRCAQKWIHYVYGGVVPDDVVRFLSFYFHFFLSVA
ncbi:hypothetical protein BC828DRAFT_182010 [Blastocladiella britannica]|nr:hypothetical protein BC828DRAFT_182010 [Blastocladiella britannica]